MAARLSLVEQPDPEAQSAITANATNPLFVGGTTLPLIRTILTWQGFELLAKRQGEADQARVRRKRSLQIAAFGALLANAGGHNGRSAARPDLAESGLSPFGRIRAAPDLAVRQIAVIRLPAQPHLP
jgi:hypothetical protein